MTGAAPVTGTWWPSADIAVSDRPIGTSHSTAANPRVSSEGSNAGSTTALSQGGRDTGRYVTPRPGYSHRMARSKVAILRTTPRTVLEDYHRLLNLADYQDVVAKDADTALKVNISWHFFYPGASTVPWQLDGVIRAMLQDGYAKDLIHACHNRTVVIDAHLGERENKQIDVVQADRKRHV